MARSRPSPGFTVRERHRVWLSIHFAAMLLGLTLLAGVNRALSPDHLWIQWAALAWAVAFLGHLSVFSRETLATMFGRKAQEGASPLDPSAPSQAK